MISLGFSVGHHMGAVIIEDGKILVGISEERLSRIKGHGAYSHVLPERSIRYCLAYLGISPGKIDRWVYSTTELPDEYGDEFEKITGVSKDFLEFIPHHLAHAYSTYFSSGFRESAVIVVDASGSELAPGSKANQWFPNIDLNSIEPGTRKAEAITIYHFRERTETEVYKKWVTMSHTESEECGLSLGMFYGTGCLQLIYDADKNNWPAGKLMGIASYADVDFVQNYPPVINLDDELYIPINRIESSIDHTSVFSDKANVAGIYQREQERVLLYLAQKAKDLTGSKNLCVAGGSFLNCNSNELIVKSDLYSECYFIPCADDSGIPLGCAWWGQGNRAFEIQKTQLSPYLGKIYSREEIYNSIMQEDGLYFREILDEDILCSEIAELIAENKVVCWFQGGSEIGPRALGNRSILANPACPWIQNYLNMDVKKREWYRPFAPSVLEENQEDIFDISNYKSRYMLVTSQLKEDWKHKLPAVTHYDNTSRFQTVTKEWNPRYHNLISKFRDITGVPVLLNTSFNHADEPIVETPSDALKTFKKIGASVLVLGDFVVVRI
jgi:carbamoyltransferase